MNSGMKKTEQGTPPDFEELLPVFREFCEVVAKLRSPDGCPWDQQQTLQSIAPYTLEETCELLEAISADDNVAIAEELGDVLLQVILDAQIAADESRFGLVDVVRSICAKMIRRHPHVFGDDAVTSAADVKRLWLQVKQREKPDRNSILDGIAETLPQLAKAARISARAASAGYDFPDRRMLFAKLQEELSELSMELFGAEQPDVVTADVNAVEVADTALSADARERAAGELGDLLFVIANIGRRWGINPEEALRRSNAKFVRRFQAIETAVRKSGKQLEQTTLAEKEEIYQAFKAMEDS